MPGDVFDLTGNTDVIDMTYRELQAECKRRSLGGMGTTDELRARLDPKGSYPASNDGTVYKVASGKNACPFWKKIGNLPDPDVDYIK